MVHEAFQFQRDHGYGDGSSNEATTTHMLHYFFERAQELGKFDLVLQMALNRDEEEELAAFLKKSSKPNAQVQKTCYFNQCNRY